MKQIHINVLIFMSVPTLKDCAGLSSSLPKSAIVQVMHKLHTHKLLAIAKQLYFLKNSCMQEYKTDTFNEVSLLSISVY